MSAEHPIMDVIGAAKNLIREKYLDAVHFVGSRLDSADRTVRFDVYVDDARIDDAMDDYSKGYLGTKESSLGILIGSLEGKGYEVMKTAEGYSVKPQGMGSYGGVYRTRVLFNPR